MLGLVCCNAVVAAPSVQIENRSNIQLPPAAIADGRHTLMLTIANIGNWDENTITAGLRIAANILAQCRVRLTGAELLRIGVAESHRHFDTPHSRELAQALALPRPTLYFTAGTRQVPAFDAEAIGRGNSRSRPELTDSIWIAPGTRDLGLVIAHELVHVLMDSGAHDSSPGNLMAEETSPQNTRLNAMQCTALRDTGLRNGLLRSGVN